MQPSPPQCRTALFLSLEPPGFFSGLHTTLRTIDRHPWLKSGNKPLHSSFCSHPCPPPHDSFTLQGTVKLRQFRLEPACLGGKTAPPRSSCVTLSKLLNLCAHWRIKVHEGLRKGSSWEFAATAVLGSCDPTAWTSLSSGPSQDQSQSPGLACSHGPGLPSFPLSTLLSPAAPAPTRGLCCSLCLECPLLTHPLPT